MAKSDSLPDEAVETLVSPRGQLLSAETVAELGQAGGYLSLALDSQGQGHLAYWSGMQTENGQLVYAVHSSRGWQHEVVASTLGAQTAIALDEVGRPLIAFIDLATAELKLARLPEREWQIETVARNLHSFAPGAVRLALNQAGLPLITYFSQDKLHLAWQLPDGTWESKPVSSPGSGLYHDLALGSNGRPVIVSHDLTSQTISLLRVAANGAVTSERLDDVNGAVSGGEHVALSLDEADQAHLCFVTAAGLTYATRAGDVWRTQVIEAGAGIGFYGAIQVGKGMLAASYYDADQGCLKLARWEKCAWHVEMVDEDGDTGGYNALVLDKENTAHIAYYNWDLEAFKFVQVSGPPPVSTKLAIMPVIQWTPERHVAYGGRFYNGDPIAVHPVGGKKLEGTFVILRDGHVEPLNDRSVLEVGHNQTVIVKFEPADRQSFCPVAQAYQVNVSKATPKIVWPNEKEIIFAKPRPAEQLDLYASAEVGGRGITLAGTFSYSLNSKSIKPGDQLPIGHHTLWVQFEPDDREHYELALESVQLHIGIATIHVLLKGETFSHLALKYYGHATPYYWQWIIDANKGNIPEEYRLTRVGTKIFIPPPPPPPDE